MIQDHEIIICMSPVKDHEIIICMSPVTYRIILERPTNEEVNQIQDKIILKVKILDTGLVLIPYQGYASECHSVLLDNLYLRFLSNSSPSSTVQSKSDLELTLF